MANSGKSHSIDAVTAALHAAVTSCLMRYVRAGEHVAVALSGGIDSVCLLHVIVDAVRRENLPVALSALHVHHSGLHPHDGHWETFCREFCSVLDLPYVCTRVTVAMDSGAGLEGAARKVRHAAFASAPADWVMLAHHRDDQAETLLFNLLRGSGLVGAAAMRARNRRLLRPFLHIGKETIARYVHHHGLRWYEDESNADQRLTRNFLRQQIFPQLEERFPAAAANFAAAAARFAEANDLLVELARIDLPAGQDGFPVPVAALQALSEPRARNALRCLLADNAVQIPSEARLREALRQMLAAEQDRHPAVVFGRHRLLRRRGWIHLESLVV